MSCYITACGMALPERIVTNAELAPILGVTPDWIEANSGIRARRWVSANQSASDLATTAVYDALSQGDCTAAQIDYLIGLNAPELGQGFLQDTMRAVAPDLAFVQRLPNPAAFADVSAERSLKVLVYQAPA